MKSFFNFKSILLSNQSRLKTQTGEIINLMQVNANSFTELARFGNNLWAAPVEIILSFFILYKFIGYAVFAGLGAMLILVI
mgnify:CR=1 FL=1